MLKQMAKAAAADGGAKARRFKPAEQPAPAQEAPAGS